MEINNSQRLHFDFSQAFQNTKDFIDHHNSKQTQLTDKLNANHRATAELIVRLYLKQLNHARSLQGLKPGNLPGFSTYNTSLAKCKGCTKRTIMNHRDRLVKAGFITKEQHCGKGGVEIWINPTVLGTAKHFEYLPDNVTRLSKLTPFFGEKEKNFRPLVHEQHEQINNNSSVDKSGVRFAHDDGLTAGTPPNPSPSGRATRTHEHDMNMGENATPASNKQQASSKKQEQALEAGRIFLLTLIRQFWSYARKVLYPGLILSEAEEKEILNHTWASVFKKLQMTGSQKQWENYQGMLFERVNMVRRWLDRNPNHWIPEPYLYFHPGNEKNGFNKTWEWYLKQETLKIETRNQLLIQQVKAEWKQYDRGKGRLRQKTRLQLFRIQQKRLARYQDEALNQAYLQSLHQSFHLNKLIDHAVRKRT